MRNGQLEEPANVTLFGRADALAAVDRELANARAGGGHALVVRGEAGIGKSAVLQYAAGQARTDGMRVLSGSGIETEAELPFAGLHLLLLPVLDQIDALEPDHAATLHRALGTGKGATGGVPSRRFAVGVAVLALLKRLCTQGEHGGPQSILVTVDDAHWLDAASADALLFAARRLAGQPVALVFGARDLYAPPFPADGIADLRLDGLAAGDAEALLAAHAHDVPRHVRDQIATEARGNPLALLELSAAWREGNHFPLPFAASLLPVHSQIQRTFADRIAALPEHTQTAVLVAAADGTCDTGTVLRAAERLGASLDDLKEAEEAHLLMFNATCLGFRHPLARAAAYQRATMPQRLLAHRALVDVLDGAGDADRRAWHLAAATTGPDEEAAQALETSAEHARDRGGFAAVAAAYERAANLSPSRDARGRRLAVAARAAADAGQPERAGALVSRATAELTDPVELAWAWQTYAMLAEDAGDPLRTHQVLSGAARSVAGRNGVLAGNLLLRAAEAARTAGAANAAAEAAELARELRVPDAELVADVATVAAGEPAAGVAALRRLVSAVATEPECADKTLALRCRVSQIIWHLLLGEHASVVELASGVVRDGHARVAAGVLPEGLALLARAELGLGRYPDARAHAAEGLRIAATAGNAAGTAHNAGVLAQLAAMDGDEQRVTELGARTSPASAAAALGLLDLGLGRHESALDRLQSLVASERPAQSALAVVPDLVEAAVRAGRPAEASAAQRAYTEWAEETAHPWALALAVRGQALLGEPHLFPKAVELHDQEPGQPFERARTLLAYGEWTRRERRRTTARAMLREAAETFERLGARPWAERARTELRATGETLGGTRAQDADPAGRLTPQELRIVQLAADGLTNRDIGTRLFLSPRTVGYHLYKAYPKLGVSSRRQLATLALQTC